MDFGYSPRTQELRENLSAFMDTHVAPSDAERRKAPWRSLDGPFGSPAKLNGFTPQMLDQLSQAYHRFEDDPSARVAVLYAFGPHFSAGLQLDLFEERLRSGRPLSTEGLVDPFQLRPPFRTKPCVAAMQGICFTLACEAAFRMRLVQEVVEPGRQLERAIEIAERISAQAPLAVAATLANARTMIREGHPAAAAELGPVQARLLETEDAAEGVQSFREHRAAAFRGR
jgi:enoyl-CoA hydratase